MEHWFRPDAAQGGDGHVHSSKGHAMRQFIGRLHPVIPVGAARVAKTNICLAELTGVECAQRMLGLC